MLLHTAVFSELSFFVKSVLDLNAFERQNKAEGLGMVTEEGTRKYNKGNTSDSNNDYISFFPPIISRLSGLLIHGFLY